MRMAVVNQATAIMLACAPACSPQAAAKGVSPETANSPLCGWLHAVDHWLLNPPLPDLPTPGERLPLGPRTEPGQIVAAAPAVLPKIDVSHSHRGGLFAAISAKVPRHSLFSVLCLLIV